MQSLLIEGMGVRRDEHTTGPRAGAGARAPGGGVKGWMVAASLATLIGLGLLAQVALTPATAVAAAPVAQVSTAVPSAR